MAVRYIYVLPYVTSYIWVPAFRRTLSPPSSGWKMPKVVSNVLHRFETWSLPEGVILHDGVREQSLEGDIGV